MQDFSKMFADTPVKTKPFSVVKEVQDFHVDNLPVPMQQASVTPEVLKRIQTLQSIKKDEVNTFGSGAGDALTKLSEQISKRVTVADSGEFGQGIVQILKLTETVDINKLGKTPEGGLGGLIAKAKAAFVGAKVDVMAQFNSVGGEIDKIGTTLMTGVDRMKQDSVWLESCYQENLKYLHDMELNAEALELFMQTESNNLSLMQQNQVDPMEIADQHRFVDRISRHLDKTLKLVHVAKLTAPEIRLMQETNYNNSEDFKDLIQTTIPAWKKKIGLALVSARQKRDTEFSNTIKDKSNEFFKQAADMVHDNSIAAATNRQKSSLEIETIEYIQERHIDAVKQVKQIEEEGRRKRADAANKLKQLNQSLYDEMKTW